jgi:hypothetical protein
MLYSIIISLLPLFLWTATANAADYSPNLSELLQFSYKSLQQNTNAELGEFYLKSPAEFNQYILSETESRDYHVILLLTSSQHCAVCKHIQLEFSYLALKFNQYRLHANQSVVLTPSKPGSVPFSPLHRIFFIVFDAMSGSNQANLQLFRRYNITNVPRVLFIKANTFIPEPILSDLVQIDYARSMAKISAKHSNLTGENSAANRKNHRNSLRRSRYVRFHLNTVNSTKSLASGFNVDEFDELQHEFEPLHTENWPETIAESDILAWSDAELDIQAGFTAPVMANWIALRTNLRIPLRLFERPVNTTTKSNIQSHKRENQGGITSEAVISLLISAFLLYSYLSGLLTRVYQSELIQSRQFWFSLALILYFFCISGGQYNIKRNSALYNYGTGALLHSSPRDQYLLEGYCAGIITILAGFAAIFLVREALGTGPSLGNKGKYVTRREVEQNTEKMRILEEEIQQELAKPNLSRDSQQQIYRLQYSIRERKAKNALLMQEIMRLEKNSADGVEVSVSEESVIPAALWFDFSPAQLCILCVVILHLLSHQLRAFYTSKMPSYRYGFVDLWT